MIFAHAYLKDQDTSNVSIDLYKNISVKSITGFADTKSVSVCPITNVVPTAFMLSLSKIFLVAHGLNFAVLK